MMKGELPHISRAASMKSGSFQSLYRFHDRDLSNFKVCVIGNVRARERALLGIRTCAEDGMACVCAWVFLMAIVVDADFAKCHPRICPHVCCAQQTRTFSLTLSEGFFSSSPSPKKAREKETTNNNNEDRRMSQFNLFLSRSRSLRFCCAWLYHL
jgi:hypothetical protein